jgi:dihydroflavonol-4-reductase
MVDARDESRPVLVTGASGFIGSAVVRALLADGFEVRALCEPGRDDDNLAGLPAERIVGDIRDAATLDRAVAGVSTVFHLAAIYRFWAADPELFYDVNVGGALNVIRAVQQAGCDRLVYTSTVGTIGVAENDHLASEETLVHFEQLFGHYKRSKYLAEHEVLRAGAAGLPVVLVHPTFPVGERDTAPTPTGRTIVEFLNGRIPAYVDTALNVVHVDDVARGHLLAHDRGAVGRSYILGSENMSLQHLLATLASITGLPEPRLRVPRALSLAAATVSDLVEGKLLRRTPSVPLEAARMSTTRMAFDDTRARTELGFAPRPAAQALADAARWYVDNDRVKPERASRITWRDDRHR